MVSLTSASLVPSSIFLKKLSFSPTFVSMIDFPSKRMKFYANYEKQYQGEESVCLFWFALENLPLPFLFALDWWLVVRTCTSGNGGGGGKLSRRCSVVKNNRLRITPSGIIYK
jgi:hypothetical protein